jgi:hypothetical protein
MLILWQLPPAKRVTLSRDDLLLSEKKFIVIFPVLSFGCAYCGHQPSILSIVSNSVDLQLPFSFSTALA